MGDAWTKINLDEVEDAAPGNGVGDRWEARVGREPLDARRTGLTQRSPFNHRHREAEEVYVILAGDGRVKLGDELRPVAPLDAIRIGPEVPRAFEAGPGGLEFIAFGAHHEADGEGVEDDWVE